MATRAIVTSHPVIACDVCGRRLLRGENPDVFLAGGQRRMVCELCVPRAASEGWLREADDHALSVRPTRARRAGSLLERLRQLREPSDRTSRRGETRRAPGYAAADSEGMYSFLEPIEGSEPAEHEVAGEDQAIIAGWEAARASDGEASSELGLDEDLRSVTSGELKVARALEVFNAGDQTRRVAGVARSLGAPSVTVRPLEDSGGTVSIVVAWELCWYRYQVDLGNEADGAQLVSQGMELDELAEEDRLANVTADDRGELVPLFA
jgi:hypothetical protein